MNIGGWTKSGRIRYIWSIPFNFLEKSQNLQNQLDIKNRNLTNQEGQYFL